MIRVIPPSSKRPSPLARTQQEGRGRTCTSRVHPVENGFPLAWPYPHPFVLQLDTLLRLELPPRTVRRTEAELVPVQLEPYMRPIQHGL
jgi:hypothetical protein